MLFSLIAPMKSVYVKAILISGKLPADLPAVSFESGSSGFVAYVNNKLSPPLELAQLVMLRSTTEPLPQLTTSLVF